MNLAWGNAVCRDFIDGVLAICDGFGWQREKHASWLMACMAFETGESFSPSVRNAAGSGAVGLIQFMPNTALALGTTPTQLAAMSAAHQLGFVREYFKPYARKIDSLAGMYMAILMPKYVGSPDDATLFLDPSVQYRQNAGLDANKDGAITKAEAAGKVLAKLDKGMQAPYVRAV